METFFLLYPLLRQSGLQVKHFYCQTRSRKLISKYYKGIIPVMHFLIRLKKTSLHNVVLVLNLKLSYIYCIIVG